MKSGRQITSVNEDNGTRTIGYIPQTSVYLLQNVTGDDSDKVLKKIQKNSAVDSVEVDVPLNLNSTDMSVESGPDLGHAMADLLDGTSRSNFYGIEVLKSYAMQPAMDVTQISAVRHLSTGVATRVAYIDTGVDPDHPALKPWLEPGTDLINGSSVSEMDGLDHAMADLLDHAMADLLDNRFFFILNRSLAGPSFPGAFGHGTMVAGLIHVAAPEARIFPIKAFDSYGSTTMYRVIQGVYAAIDADADVLNMSFSTTEDSEALRKALDAAHAKGMSLVAAAGNEGRFAVGRYPASYNSVYGVAATELDDRLASFSNYGSAISVTAPGAMVVSTAPRGHYAVAWGTSFSTPIVAGSMALLASVGSKGHSDSALVVNMADSIDAKNPGFERKLGKGRINLSRALKVK